MGVDDETRAFYDGAAADYADRFAAKGQPDGDLIAFLSAVPPKARLLDLGCGPGRSAALMAEAGHDVDATDASDGMIEVARNRYGIAARKARFDELDAEADYDGIWANFSLLHAPRSDMSANLARIRRALKNGGILHLGLKEGSGENRDHLGRFYTYYTESELRGLVAEAGFLVTSVRRGRGKGMAGTDDPFLILLAQAVPADG